MENLEVATLSSNITDVGLDELWICSERIPSSREMFLHLPMEGYVYIVILTLFSLATVLIYIEEVHFIRRRFKNGTRTIWVLACYPVFSVTGLLGVFIPRAGTVADMISSGFFSACLYNFGCLMVHYMGGSNQLWRVFDTDRTLTLNAFPCCCCICLPHVTFQRSVYDKIRILLIQVVILRPILTFIAVVVWADGTFSPGGITAANPYSYINIANFISTMFAIYGLMLLRNAFRPELEKHFKITGKIGSVQISLITSILPNIIIAILVSTDVIQCGRLFPSKARGEEIYHGILVLLMLPYSLISQRYFRRSSDAVDILESKYKSGNGNSSVHVMIDPNNWINITESSI